MPTVHQEDGFDFMIYTFDHEPAHVHVFKGGEEVVINLGDAENGPSIRDNKDMKKKNAKKATRIAESRQNFLLEKWEEIHG